MRNPSANMGGAQDYYSDETGGVDGGQYQVDNPFGPIENIVKIILNNLPSARITPSTPSTPPTDVNTEGEDPSVPPTVEGNSAALGGEETTTTVNLPADFKWDGSWSYITNYFGYKKDSREERNPTVLMCPDKTWVEGLWINPDKSKQFVVGIHGRCSDGQTEFHFGPDYSTTFVGKRASYLKYYNKLNIRSEWYIHMIENVGAVLGEGPYEMAGNSDYCALVGFKLKADGKSILRQLAAAFQCNRPPVLVEAKFSDVLIQPHEVKLKRWPNTFVVDERADVYSSITVGQIGHLTIRELQDQGGQAAGCGNGNYINHLGAKFDGVLKGLQWSCTDDTTASIGDVTGDLMEITPLTPSTNYYNKLEVSEDLGGIYSINEAGTAKTEKKYLEAFNRFCALVGFQYKDSEAGTIDSLAGLFICQPINNSVG
jgi:hypothetical protein